MVYDSLPNTSEELLRRYADGERDFPGAILEGINLFGGRKQRTNLVCARTDDVLQILLEDADVREATLDHAVLLHEDLHDAQLEDASMRGVGL